MSADLEAAQDLVYEKSGEVEGIKTGIDFSYNGLTVDETQTFIDLGEATMLSA